MKKFILPLIFAAGAALSAQASDLGTYGATFDISEVDLLKYLGAKLKAAEDKGQIGAMNRRFAETSEHHIENPPPVAGIVRTVKPRAWLFDPSMTVERDLADTQGRIFAHAGERINPLDQMPTYRRVLVFLDGADAKEVRFAAAKSKALGADRVMLILTSGAPVELMKGQHLTFYYDQEGLLTRRFGITQVPAVVERAGNRLRISEVTP